LRALATFEGRLAARASSHPGFLAQGKSQPVRLNAASFATCESEKPGEKNEFGDIDNEL
jgi:hypothetical protein